MALNLTLTISLPIQILLLVLWTLLWRRRRSLAAKEVMLQHSPEMAAAASTTDSLSYIYDAGIPRRLN